VSKYDRARYAGIIFKCPFEHPARQVNPTDCQLHEMRKLSLEERLSWWLALSDQEADSYIEKHRVCLSCKEHASFPFTETPRPEPKKA